MVVDIRYHMATLVAVFFALGLGVLVGASLFSDAKNARWQEEWMTAVEREVDALRMSAKQMTKDLDQTARERDAYLGLVGDLAKVLLQGRLEHFLVAPIAVVEGENAKKGEDFWLDSFLEGMGAHLLPPVHMDARMLREADTMSQTVASLWANGFRDDPLLENNGEEGFAPMARAVVFLHAPPELYADDVSRFIQALQQLGIDRIVAVSFQEAWRLFAADHGLPFVLYDDSVFGGLSVSLLLASDDDGGYGGAFELWPRHLLLP